MDQRSKEAIEVMDRLERASAELAEAIRAALSLVKQMVKDMEARIADDDDWRRMPLRKERSEGGWSLRKLQLEIKAGRIRKKSVAGFPYYSASDVRKLIAES
jgi:hypothetical protein